MQHSKHRNTSLLLICEFDNRKIAIIHSLRCALSYFAKLSPRFVTRAWLCNTALLLNSDFSVRQVRYHTCVFTLLFPQRKSRQKELLKISLCFLLGSFVLLFSCEPPKLCRFVSGNPQAREKRRKNDTQKKCVSFLFTLNRIYLLQ